MKTKYTNEETTNLKTEINTSEKEHKIKRQNSERNIRVVTLADFHKQDHTRFLILPKRRADTNSVYGFGLKYAINQEQKIVKDFKNENYFIFEYNILRNRIRNDANLREKIIKRILLNKNLKKQFALLEKPFPLLGNISNCKAINKSEEFLLSMIMNHKFDIGEELLMELIDIRKNKVFDFIDQEKQKRSFLRAIDKKIFDKNEEGQKKSSAAMINLIEFKRSNLSKRTKTFNSELEEENNLNFNFLTKEENENSRNRLNFNLSDKDSKNNGSVENKNDFFLISSNFSRGKNTKRGNLKRKKPVDEDINLSQKQELDLIKSLEFEHQRYKYETSELPHNAINDDKKEKENRNLFGNENNFNDNNINRNFIENQNMDLNNQLYNNNNKHKTIFFTNIKSQKSSQKNLTIIQNNLSAEKNASLQNINNNNKELNINIANNTSSNNIYNNINFSNNLEESVSKTKISMRNVSTFNSNVNLKNLSRRNEKDDSRSRIQHEESSLNQTDNLINLNKSANKTVSTENDFRKFNKNAINKILNSKRNNKANAKPYFHKPDFIKYKYPEESNKPNDFELDKIKMFANRQNKSSQIKSRVFGPQYNININVLSKLKQQAENSNLSDNANNMFTFDNNYFGGFKAVNFSNNNTFEIEFGNENNFCNGNKKSGGRINDADNKMNYNFRSSYYRSGNLDKKITQANSFSNFIHKQEKGNLVKESKNVGTGVDFIDNKSNFHFEGKNLNKANRISLKVANGERKIGHNKNDTFDNFFKNKSINHLIDE